MKKIIFSVTNDLVTEKRVDRIASSLVKAGYDVSLIGFRHYNAKDLSKRLYSTYRFRMFFRSSIWFYIEYNIKLFRFLMNQKADILVANDLDTLIPCYLTSLFKRSELVYDSHEFFTEVPELQGRFFTRAVWLAIEKLILPRVKHSYTVSQSIADEYSKKYNLKMQLVRNIPYKNSLSAPKEKMTEPNSVILNALPLLRLTGSDFKIIIYQGALNMGRGIEETIMAMHHVKNAFFLIAGSGYMRREIIQLIQKENLEDKVYFLGKIPFENLVEITCRAHIGISLEKNMGLSYYYSLPNKLFDYIQANVPILASPLPEIKNIVENYNLGLFIENYEPEHIASKLEFMLHSKCARNLWKQHLAKAAKELCWENEEHKVIEVFKTVIS